MQAIKVLQTILARENVSAPTISKRIGRNRAYVNTIFASESMPQMDTLVTILDACGYDLIARNRADGTEHVIEP